jgi:hypothetical protein
MKNNKFKITHLKCREIQAPIVAALIKGFGEEMGHDKASEIARKVIGEDAILSGKRLAERYSGNSMAELWKIVKEEWAQDGAMEISKIKATEKHLYFDVTYCGYAEMYAKMGIKKLGVLLSCGRDFLFTQGFNPEITLRRTKTLMEGAECCDFRFSKVEKKDSD